MGTSNSLVPLCFSLFFLGGILDGHHHEVLLAFCGRGHFFNESHGG